MPQHPANSKDIEKWLSLIRADSIGPVTFKKLITHFGSIDYALSAPPAALAQITGIGSKTAQSIAKTRHNFNPKKELQLAEKLGVSIINLLDPRYPKPLKSIPDPPPVLYLKGSLTPADNLAVAIVGSRRCSLYGKEQASRLAHLLASAGFTIVSGMARGIDTAAHQGALSASGRTIAVAGSGLANTFPPENKQLAELITNSGAYISELPLNFEPLAENFPPRNRIIAGLSLATIVVEAGLRSGALITANAALEYNREVMAVPGKIDSPLSKGSHQLIKQGAKLIDSLEDIMDALGYIGDQLKVHVSSAAQKANDKIQKPLFDVSQLKLTPTESQIFQLLSKEPLHIEEIIAESDLSTGSINAALISLRLKALIKQLPGNFYLKR